MTREEFKDAFPALSEELEEGSTKSVGIDGVRTMSDQPDSGKGRDHKTFMPDIVDYIRRCDTITQAIEIIDYMLGRGELSRADARDIKLQLKQDGLRSFGAKKEKDHYLHHGIEPE